MANGDRTVYGGGASSGGLRVPPGSEVGVPLGHSGAVSLTATQQYVIEWTDDDDAGVPLAAGAVAFPAQKMLLNVEHTGLEITEDGYYQSDLYLPLTAGGSGADVRVQTPEGSFEHAHIPASTEEAVKLRQIWPYPGGTLSVSVYVIAGSVDIGYCNLYVKRLSE